MYKIYHNPRCRKSREALDFLKTQNVDHEVVLYLENNFSKEDLKILLNQLKIDPKKIIRRQEQVWKENFKNKDLNEDQYLEIIITYPILIERPIITYKNKGVIGRPIDNLEKFIENN